ncbi:exosortase-associated protein EpsI, V-type [Phenylobacterium sp.]|uniref:exosortase-associated protein EpsI, V-type n=1 Tax=Phenylobacterium sp. TaxID=1871053 RepID=UPI002731F3A3|nr:exosortase-associated protein EpsI, V-type [Phenylobacterium sp.]MDP1598215.1 EpsI family protein [Phenylobacterium sp.]MDP3594721.1 EpsI family protein [Phenylobacterium sp.]
MIARRDLLIGGACVAAAGAAYALTPRKRLVLLNGGKLADAIPLTFGDWSAENSDGLVQPKAEGDLASTLYSEMVGRIYHQASTGAAVMMLIAYGDTQSDMLQLHRPEACYPAVGFNLIASVPAKLKLHGGGEVPVRRVVAKAQGRQENIVYWARMGEYLPASGGEQRQVRLQTAMAGYVPDGGLIRFSVVGDDTEAAFKLLDDFIPELLAAVPANKRPALVGTKLAKTVVA